MIRSLAVSLLTLVAFAGPALASPPAEPPAPPLT